MKVGSEGFLVKNKVFSYDSFGWAISQENTPILGLSIWTLSPTLSGPTPEGVPVKIISPGWSVHHQLSLWINLLIGEIMSLVLPRCLSFPLTEQENDQFSRLIEVSS